MPQALRELFINGNAAIGEVGTHRPDVCTLTLPGGASAIEFTTGMMDFVYAVSRALTGAVTGWGRSGLEYKAAKGVSEVTPHVAKTFEQWGKKWGAFSWFPWNWGRIKKPDFWITEGAWQLGEKLATVAETFMLSHELGHVAINTGIHSPKLKNTEEAADEFGLSIILRDEVQLRFPFAAAIFSVRIFAGLERFGVRFSDAYPPQVQRVALLNSELLSMSPSKQYFHEVSTIAAAYQSMLDEVDNIISGGSSILLSNEDGALIGFIGMLEEVTRGRLPEDKFVEEFIHRAGRTQETALPSVFSRLLEYYTSVPPGVAYLPETLRLQMGGRLLNLIPKLPESLRKSFHKG